MVGTVISPEQLVAELVGVGLAGSMFGAVIDAMPSEGQQWTAFGLLAVVLGWFMHKQSKAQDATIQAMNEVAKAMALLTQRETDAQHATEQKRAEIVAKLDRLAEHVQALKA